jgi:hypothetical protein
MNTQSTQYYVLCAEWHPVAQRSRCQWVLAGILWGAMELDSRCCGGMPAKVLKKGATGCQWWHLEGIWLLFSPYTGARVP